MTRSRYRAALERRDGRWMVHIVDPSGRTASTRACRDEDEARTFASTVPSTRRGCRIVGSASTIGFPSRGSAEEEPVGFNPMQGRRPNAGDLAVFLGSLVVLAVIVLWGFRVL